MKIDCDKCGAKYSIADEKVRGKTFQFPCRKCSNLIIGRDKASGGGAADSSAGMTVAHVGWHLAINGETVGPLSEDEVRQRYAAREIDKDTAIWQEGFEDWMPLGDVGAFADLPEQTAAAAHDPFSGFSDDDGAGPAAGEMAAGAMAGFASASSPRVSKLTGQRNENSVLFSLDSLQALATGAPPAGASARPSGKTLATQAPASEGSGLIDIRALGAMVQGEKREAPGLGGGATSGRGDEPALPSFGGAGLAGLGASPLIASTVEPAAAAVAAPPASRSTTPLYIMMGLLVMAVAALAYTSYIFATRPDPEPEKIVVERLVPGEVLSADAAAEDEEDEKDRGGRKGKTAKADDDERPKAKSSSSAKRPERSRTRARDRKPSNTASKPSKAAAPSPSPSSESSSSSDSLDVDCILNPDLAKCKSGSKGGSKSTSKPAAAPDPNLPVQLNQPQLRAAVDPHKGAARACGSKHGAKPREKVQVKLSISGSGSVLSASAQGSHAGTALGGCVESVFKKIKFPKFQKERMGVLYPVFM